jgi:hypothetical protein
MTQITYSTFTPTVNQGAVLHSTAPKPKQYNMFYGTQSATFTKTVQPGEGSGVYRMTKAVNLGTKRIPTANESLANRYTPSVAAAYYSTTAGRIIPNRSFFFS